MIGLVNDLLIVSDIEWLDSSRDLCLNSMLLLDVS